MEKEIARTLDTVERERERERVYNLIDRNVGASLVLALSEHINDG